MTLDKKRLNEKMIKVCKIVKAVDKLNVKLVFSRFLDVRETNYSQSLVLH